MGIRFLITGIIAVILGSISNSSFADEKNCSHTETSFQCVKIRSIYDGDTLRVDIPSLHPLLGQNIGIRVRGIDTPEKRTKDQCEKKQAYKALDLVKSELSNAKTIRLENCSRGKYFRLVCDVVYEGRNLAKTLIDRKLARVYDGGTKSKESWCK